MDAPTGPLMITSTGKVTVEPLNGKNVGNATVGHSVLDDVLLLLELLDVVEGVVVEGVVVLF